MGHSVTDTVHDKLERDTQQINLHILGYSIFANFSERYIIEMQQHKFPYNVKLINFMKILFVATNSVNEILHERIQLYLFTNS